MESAGPDGDPAPMSPSAGGRFGQLDSVSYAELFVRFARFVPSPVAAMSILKISAFSVRSVANQILVPSGDQSDASSELELLVRRVTDVPSPDAPMVIV